MLVDLNEKMLEHFSRIEKLSVEAEGDAEETFAQRASAMSAMTVLLRDLTKAQEELVNMERLMIMEQTVIEILQKYLTPEQHEEFIKEVEEKLGNAGMSTTGHTGMDNR